ncbi:hypothetical protein Q8F55_007034 [Vanrija albida]|uniref:NmrA-like domain-containing protein n=1 Tax=Vanrija albida TaxID=181172 RepID=A0ABR3PYR0_9TREE
MSRSILVTGATGKQGGAVVDALLENLGDFNILAVTRDPSSDAAKALAAKSTSIKLVKGDLNHAPALFAAAKAASTTGSIWGVFLVGGLEMQVDPVEVASAPEVKQGIAVIDEALKEGISHIVYTSVDRGGEEASWTNPTVIPHFQTKHAIEQYLRKAAEGTALTWTISRPTIFMDNLVPGQLDAIMLGAVDNLLKDKRQPWVATRDIGRFVAAAFRDPAALNHRAVTVASDDVNFAEIDAAFRKVTGKPAPASADPVPDFLLPMFHWFRDDGYKADLPELRKYVPQLTNFEAWLKNESQYPKA